MKDFEDFKKYMHSDGSFIHDEIANEVNALAVKANIKDPLEEHEFFRRAWVEVGFMKLIEQYHNWLNS